MSTQRAWIPAALLLFLVPGCSSGTEEARTSDAGEAPVPDAPPVNTLTDEEIAQGWRLLFDGETTDGWRGFRRGDAPDGWSVEEGTLTRTAPAGDLMTEEEFADFELALEWKVEPAGNSGIFIRATEEVEQIYFGAPEMQILDDEGHRDGLSRLTAAGSNYDLHPAPEGVVRPAGEWNEVRILVDGARVEQWMNGVRVVAYELWSPEWEELVANSKFAEWPEYGRARSGHIGLQDHGDRVWFRNIKIREIR